MSNTTPTIIVASSALLREGVTSLLQGTPFKVVSAVRNPAELANRKLTDRALAIIGIDWRNRIHDQAGQSIRLLRTLMPESKIVLVAEANAPVDLRGVLALAPDGYIINPGSRDLLVTSLELILMGQQIFVLSRPIGALANTGDDIQFPERALDSRSASSYEFGKKTDGIQLSHRERQVLISLAHGESNKGIARAYDISEATVKVHLKTILRKTKMRNRTQAAIWAIDHELCDSTLNDNAEMPERHPETTPDAPSLSPTEPPTGDRLAVDMAIGGTAANSTASHRPPGARSPKG